MDFSSKKKERKKNLFNIDPLKHIKVIIENDLKITSIWKYKVLESQILSFYNYYVNNNLQIRTEALAIKKDTIHIALDRRYNYEFALVKGEILNQINTKYNFNNAESQFRRLRNIKIDKFFE